jgi:hypothetical protein
MIARPDLFLALAEQQTPAPVKARLRAAEARQSRRAQERDDEQQKLSAYYRAARKQELDAALAGPDGDLLRDLIARLGALTIETIPALTAFVQANGLRASSADALFLALRMTSETIVKLRETSGLAPFDDPLPGDPATPEQELREAFADQANRDQDK